MTKEFSDYGQIGSADIMFYRSAAEVALMHFLDYLQGNSESLSMLSEGAEKEMAHLADRFAANDCMEGLICSSLFFLQNVSSKVLEEFMALGKGMVGHGSVSIGLDGLDGYVGEYGIAIKHVVAYSKSKSCLQSYCTVQVPVAYLLRSRLDVNGFAKPWPADYVVAGILKSLQSYTYSSPRDLDCVVGALAGKTGDSADILPIMVQAVLVKPLIGMYLEGEDLAVPFREIVDKLIRKAGG